MCLRHKFGNVLDNTAVAVYNTIMSNNKTQASCLQFLIVLAIILVPLTMWTDRNLDFWLTHFSDKTVDVPWWASGLVAFFGNGFTILGNLIGEIARLCI